MAQKLAELLVALLAEMSVVLMGGMLVALLAAMSAVLLGGMLVALLAGMLDCSWEAK